MQRGCDSSEQDRSHHPPCSSPTPVFSVFSPLGLMVLINILPKPAAAGTKPTVTPPSSCGFSLQKPRL